MRYLESQASEPEVQLNIITNNWAPASGPHPDQVAPPLAPQFALSDPPHPNPQPPHPTRHVSGGPRVCAPRDAPPPPPITAPYLAADSGPMSLFGRTAAN